MQVWPQTYLLVTHGMQVAVDQKPQTPGAASLPMLASLSAEQRASGLH